eukprot:gene17991-24404_t
MSRIISENGSNAVEQLGDWVVQAIAREAASVGRIIEEASRRRIPPLQLLAISVKWSPAHHFMLKLSSGFANVKAMSTVPAKPLVVVGSANADLVFSIDRLPKDGETMGGKSVETLPGGKDKEGGPLRPDGLLDKCAVWHGANQVAAKLGCPTFFGHSAFALSGTPRTGANQAAAAAKLGYPTYFAGQVGEDGNAAMLRECLAASGCKLEHMKTVPGPTGTALILLQTS